MTDGCFCTENAQCNSRICEDFHCKSITFIPTAVLTLSFIMVVVVIALLVLSSVFVKKTYLVAHSVPVLKDGPLNMRGVGAQ